LRLLLLLPVLASCLWLGHSEVVTSFASCPRFFYEETTPNEALQPQNAAWICQRYSNQYHFATLYDRDRRIPVYSAYVYQPGTDKRPHSWWFVEPQVSDGVRWPQDKAYAGSGTGDERVRLSVEGFLEWCFRQSHENGNNKSATFTLTNIVPQDSTLNKGAWKEYEKKMMAQKTQGCTSTYVIVGAVPGNTYIANGRVNVPSHIWSAACCQTNTNMKAWAVIAENDKNQVQSLTLGKLEKMLTQLCRGKKVSLFHSECP
ncbi:ENDD1 protein, partial [Picathartes gymnocephalus]|nr:ENDD1 protein [Picathartes gymnocephalus]